MVANMVTIATVTMSSISVKPNDVCFLDSNGFDINDGSNR